MKKRVISILLALCMVLSLMGASALAGDEAGEDPVCVCETACTAESMNTECPVCGADGALPESCGQYVPAEEDADSIVQMDGAAAVTLTLLLPDGLSAEGMEPVDEFTYKLTRTVGEDGAIAPIVLSCEDEGAFSAGLAAVLGESDAFRSSALTAVYDEADDTLTISGAPAESAELELNAILTVAMAEMGAYDAAPAEDDHTHCVCGGENSVGDHTTHTAVTWTGISALSEITKAGNYYLEDNVTLNGYWECIGKVNLCLNGHDIIRTNSDDANVIYVNGGDLTITDCRETVGKITHAEDATGSGVTNSGTFTLWNGSITGNNTESSGGGVYNNGRRTFNMYGGSITKNTTQTSGGGVYNCGTFTVSGRVNISGNTKGEEADSNVYLDEGRTITVESGKQLSTGANIGITGNLGQTVVTGSTDTGVFTSDSDDHELVADNGNLKWMELHKHCVCGEKACTDSAHGGGVEWKGITALSEITETGNYYLKNDVTLDGTWTCSYDVNLCLNGKTLSYGNTVIKVEGNATLNICDCIGGGGITSTSGCAISVGKSGSDSANTTLNLYGGKFTGSDAALEVFGNLTLSGSPVITHTGNSGADINIKTTSDNKIKNNSITLTKDFAPTAGTTISVKKPLNITGGVVIAKPAESGSSLSDRAQCFTSALGGHFVESKDGNLYLTACAITGQPTAESNYTVTASGGSDTQKVKYQWYEAVEGVAVTNTNATPGDFNYKDGKWSFEGSNISRALDAFTLQMSKGNVLTVKPEIGGSIWLKWNNNEIYIDRGKDGSYAFEAPADGDYTLQAEPKTSLVVINGVSFHESSCSLSATISTGVAGAELAGQTAATLDTSTLEDGKYLCAVTWENKTTLYSDVVEISAPAHTHCVCGKTDCSGDGHDASTRWKPIADLNDITGDGSYYLTGNVTLTATWRCNYDINLCLNGNTITGEDKQSVIIVASGKSLAITDCGSTGKITHESGETGCGIYNIGTLTLWNGSITGNGGAGQSSGGVYNLGRFIMNGGTITGNNAESEGGGVRNCKSADFTMNGGSINNNNSVGYGGGGVYNKGSFTMNVGTISGNSAWYGGGVYNYQATFTMNGGSITGNKANPASTGSALLYGLGGGVLNNYMATFSMKGGTISGNWAKENGGGVCNYGSGSVCKLSGKVTVSGNVKGGTLENGVFTGGTANNIYLPDGMTVTVESDKPLSEGALIGVTTGSTPTAGKFVVITSGSADKECFQSDVDTYDVGTDNDGKVVLQLHSFGGDYRHDETGHWQVCQNDGCTATTAKTAHSGGTATCTTRAVCEVCGEKYGDLAPHELTHIDEKPATAAETGNTEYWHCDVCDKYFSDEDATDEIMSADTVIVKLAPTIVAGGGATVTEGEKKALSFTSDAAFEDFLRVELDGKTVDESSYTVRSGSTSITLNADYVAALAAGEHTLSIVSQSGTATAAFTVNEKPAAGAPKAPHTGDSGEPALWIAMLLISGSAVIGTARAGRRKKYNR